MMSTRWKAGVLLVVCAGSFARADVQITVDTSKAPELSDYAKKVQETAEAWYPKIVALLPSDDFKPAESVTITFDPDYKGVAAASGDRIVCAPKWFIDHPDDLGAVVHELAHVVQAYRRSRAPGWLVEGIADHVRFFHYEPEAQRPRPDARRARYDASYRTSAAFLEWARLTHDPELVVKLNAACRQGRYRDEIWTELTGKSVEELGKDWKEALAKKEAPAAKP
jgi:hypothetical protein